MLPWVWFAVALAAAGAGALTLITERARSRVRRSDRQRWAVARGWQFVEVEPVLPSRWRYGTVHHGGPGIARDLATGAVPAPDGSRLAHVFDHDQAGQVVGIVAAVRGPFASPVALELRLASAVPHEDFGLDPLGPVGRRYAFTTDLPEARRLITDELVHAADRVGDDVPLLWVEDIWVLACIHREADPARVQELLTDLVVMSVVLADAGEGRGARRDPGPNDEQQPIVT